MFQLLWLAFIPSFHTDTRSYLWKFPVGLQTFSWMSDTCTVNIILLLCSRWFCTKVNSMSCISLVSVRGWNVDTSWVDSLSVSLVSCQVWSAWKQTQLGIWATGMWFPELSCNSRARELPFCIYILCNFYIWLASAQSLSPGLGGPGIEMLSTIIHIWRFSCLLVPFRAGASLSFLYHPQGYSTHAWGKPHPTVSLRHTTTILWHLVTCEVNSKTDPVSLFSHLLTAPHPVPLIFPAKCNVCTHR